MRTVTRGELTRGLSDDERARVEREVAQAAVEDRRPFEGVPEAAATPYNPDWSDTKSHYLSAEAAQPPAPALSEPGEVFDADTDLYAALEERCEWYTMPNRKRVCVHPISGEETIWVQKQVLRELRAQGLLRETTPEEAKVLQPELQSQAVVRGYVWTAIAVCRKGEDILSKKVFKPQHADALRRNPGWIEAAQAIAQVAERLGQGESEAAFLRRLVAGFFDQLGHWLPTLFGPPIEDTPNGCPECLRTFATVASSTNPAETRLANLVRLMSQPQE